MNKQINVYLHTYAGVSHSTIKMKVKECEKVQEMNNIMASVQLTHDSGSNTKLIQIFTRWQQLSHFHSKPKRKNLVL